MHLRGNIPRKSTVSFRRSQPVLSIQNGSTQPFSCERTVAISQPMCLVLAGHGCVSSLCCEPREHGPASSLVFDYPLSHRLERPTSITTSLELWEDRLQTRCWPTGRAGFRHVVHLYFVVVSCNRLRCFIQECGEWFCLILVNAPRD